MNLVPWDPWKELELVRAESDRLWSEFLQKLSSESDVLGQRGISFLPDVDVIETPHDIRVYIGAPGLVEEDIDLSLVDCWLIVRGERQPPYDPEHTRSCRVEWRYGYFERRVKLPAVVSPRAMRATYDDGVLTVILSTD